MKRYTTLSVDYTALINEANAYIDSIGNSTLLNKNLFGATTLGTALDNPELFDAIPSLNTTFSSLGLTVKQVGYVFVMQDMYQCHPGLLPALTIPLNTPDELYLKFAEPIENARIVTHESGIQWYDKADLTITDTITVTEPLFIEVTDNTVYAFESTSYYPFKQLVIFFNEDDNTVFSS